jgi:tRNA modification GTPase
MSNRAKKVQQVGVAALVSQLTPDAVGALAVIGLAGEHASDLLHQHFSPAGGSPLDRMGCGEILAGHWQHRQTKNRGCEVVPSQAAQPEPVVLVKRAAECWEVHAHGGLAVTRSIIACLVNAGAMEVARGAWLEAAGDPAVILAGRLAAAGGWRAAQILSRQLAGAFTQDVSQVNELLDSGQPDSLAKAGSILARLKRSARVGMQLPRPWRVVLVGPVNAGKSSLINALAGYSRSLVSSLAGTTRDLLETRLTLDGWEIDLIDSAGLREVTGERLSDRVEQAGIAKTNAAMATADLILDVQPATECRQEQVVTVAQEATAKIQRLLVRSKADLCGFPNQPQQGASDEEVFTSAKTGEGVEYLAQRIIARLVPEANPGDDCLFYGVPLTSSQCDQVDKLQHQFERQLLPE